MDDLLTLILGGKGAAHGRGTAPVADTSFGGADFLRAFDLGHGGLPGGDAPVGSGHVLPGAVSPRPKMTPGAMERMVDGGPVMGVPPPEVAVTVDVSDGFALPEVALARSGRPDAGQSGPEVPTDVVLPDATTGVAAMPGVNPKVSVANTDGAGAVPVQPVVTVPDVAEPDIRAMPGSGASVEKVTGEAGAPGLPIIAFSSAQGQPPAPASPPMVMSDGTVPYGASGVDDAMVRAVTPQTSQPSAAPNRLAAERTPSGLGAPPAAVTAVEHAAKPLHPGAGGDPVSPGLAFPGRRGAAALAQHQLQHHLASGPVSIGHPQGARQSDSPLPINTPHPVGDIAANAAARVRDPMAALAQTVASGRSRDTGGGMIAPDAGKAMASTGPATAITVPQPTAEAAPPIRVRRDAVPQPTGPTGPTPAERTVPGMSSATPGPPDADTRLAPGTPPAAVSPAIDADGRARAVWVGDPDAPQAVARTTRTATGHPASANPSPPGGSREIPSRPAVSATEGRPTEGTGARMVQAPPVRSEGQAKVTTGQINPPSPRVASGPTIPAPLSPAWHPGRTDPPMATSDRIPQGAPTAPVLALHDQAPTPPAARPTPTGDRGIPALAGLAGDAARGLTPPVAEADVAALVPTGTPAPAQTIGAPGAPLPPQAAQVAQQIAAALQDRSADRSAPLDLALDPPELGRVRLSVVEIGGALTLSITAERAETADLMRRHMNLLAEELGRAGVDAGGVNISHGGGERSAGGDARPQSGTPSADPDVPPARTDRVPAARLTVDRGLDLRL